MSATTFGVVSDVYRQRIMSAYDQLEYDSAEKVVYPDLVRLRWMWHQPTGSNAWAGQGSTTAGASPRLQFLIPANCITDPHSYRVYFQCTVSGSFTFNTTTVGPPLDSTVPIPCAGLANYAHSVFNQLQVRFTGGSATEPEQVLNYNVFCSMLYQFFGRNYVQSIHANLEGWSPITLTGGQTAIAAGAHTYPAQPVTAGYYSFGQRRVWQGRSFMLPLNLGMFMSVRKMIPNFVLPSMLIEFIMETVQRATSSVMEIAGSPSGATLGVVAYNNSIGPGAYDKNLAGQSAVTPTGAGNVPSALSYVIQNPQLVVQELEVTDEYVDSLRAQVRDRQGAGNPIRLDLSSWTSYLIQIPAGTNGTYTQLVTSDVTGLRKIMFGLVNSTEDSATPPAADLSSVVSYAKDAINGFYLNWLRSYRFNVGAHYYPDQDIWIDNSGKGQGIQGGLTGNQQSLNFASQDSALSYYMNAYATGVLDNPNADIVQDWNPLNMTFDQVTATQTTPVTDRQLFGLELPNYVYLTRTEFDDEGLPSMRYLQKSGQLLIRLIFNPATGAAPNGLPSALNCYVFLNQSRSILIEEGNRAQVING